MCICGPGGSSGKALGNRLDSLGSIPGVGDFSSLLCVQTGPEVYSASYEMSTGDFPGVKAAERRASHLTSSYSVFLFLRWATNKLSSEAGNGEVTNPK